MDETLPHDEILYHPLKHDNRLRLTVRRFRALFEPADPIQAIEDGYALRGRVRVCQGT